MNEDVNNVLHLPCHLPQWHVIRDGLEHLKNSVQDPTCSVKDWVIKHQEIVNISQDEVDKPKRLHYKGCILYGLVEFLQNSASSLERRTFLRSTFPAIIDLAVDLPSVVPLCGVLHSQQQIGSETVLSKQCIASIIACGFLCLFPPQKHSLKRKLNSINFTNFFKFLPELASQQAKLRCILNYFEKVASRRYEVQGRVTFVRQVIPWEELPCMDTWLNCDVELCPLIVHHDGVIEDAGCSAIEVDFANKYIGGGVLSRGRVQEEIRFCVCPELIASLLFMEVMDDNEAIIMQGYEQYSKTSGYAATLQYDGDFTESTMVDDEGNFMTTLCAIDALQYRNDKKQQYLEQYYLRDLNKAFVGYSARVDRGTIVYPCEQLASRAMSHEKSESRQDSDSEYMSAEEEDIDTSNDTKVPLSIMNYADGLLGEIMSSALLEAGSELSCQSQHVIVDTKFLDQSSSSSASTNEKMAHDDGMDHLDVDLREWYLKLRRRSSNLSDIGSRRSSCSTRYSSDFSSEFEEYYENFQKREQLLGKHHTIKEETCHHVIGEYAAFLVSSIMHEGTAAAANILISSSPVMTEFHDDAPVTVMTKPKARKLSDEDGTDGGVIPLPVAEKFASGFLDSLFTRDLYKDIVLNELYAPDVKSNIPECTSQNDSTVAVAKQPDRSLELLEEERERRCHEMATNIVYDVMNEAVIKYLMEEDDSLATYDDDMLTRSVSESSSSPFESYSNHSESPSVKHMADSEFLPPVSSIHLYKDVQADDTCESAVNNVPMVTVSSEKVSCSILVKNNIERVKSPTAEKNKKKHAVSAEGGFHQRHAPAEVKIDQLVCKNQRKVSFYASSLSRDLLTTAFVEVQRNTNGGSYIRRSSEPLQMSNKAARQLKDSINENGGPMKKISRTDEDIGRLEQEISQEGPFCIDFSTKYRRESCGFHDDTLSRFAEELMKAECKIPEFYIFNSSNRSTSGSSSHSWRSSLSGFKDETLAKFEEELLTVGRPRSRGSLKRKRSSKSKKLKSKSMEKLTDQKDGKSSIAYHARRSADSETSLYSLTCSSSTPSPPLEELSNFAEQLSHAILADSFKVISCGASTTCYSPRKPSALENVTQFADSVAMEILNHALSELRDITAMHTVNDPPLKDDSREVSEPPLSEEEFHSLSDEYTDAYDVPFKRLEEFADILAFNVIQRSINVFKREEESTKRRNIGRPISTGNWGCGAFCGDPQLKALLQWMAASYAGVPYIMYYTFHHEKLIKLQETVDSILSRGWTVCHLMQALRNYCQTTYELMEQPNEEPPDLLDALLYDDSFSSNSNNFTM